MKTRARNRPLAGFSLVELMVALTLGMLLTLGLVQIFASSNESYHALSQTAQQIENGRHAVQTIGNDLMHAGYYGEFGFAAPAGTTLPDPCEIGNLVAMRNAMAFHVQGYDAPALSPLPCLDNDNFVPGTDIIVIRRASTSITPAAALVANEVYLQATADISNSANPVLDRGGNAGAFVLTRKDGVTPADLRKYVTRIYFISPCSVPAAGDVCGPSADAGRPIPTLKRLELAVNAVTGNLELRIESIAEGIENLQLDYGIDGNGDGLPDTTFVTTPAAVSEWGDVTVAQVHVLARNPLPTAGHVDTKSYQLGAGGAVTPGGNFRRHAFSAQFRLVNPASRREAP